ncbi:MAG: hypothetical protein H7Y43_11185 [Akkermansiaceae bacterium]|nr:hypothetical protein [Verrucomicrobiales bacterium]
MSLLADQGKGLRLQAHHLHDTPTPPTPPAVVREQITQKLGSLARDRWHLLTDEDYIEFPRNVRRAQSTMEIPFPPGEFDELETILAELLKIHGQPKRASWWVSFVDYFRNREVFYRRILDDAERWFHFPRPEVLKATGLKGDATELIKLVNEAGFLGQPRTSSSKPVLNNSRMYKRSLSWPFGARKFGRRSRCFKPNKAFSHSLVLAQTARHVLRRRHGNPKAGKPWHEESRRGHATQRPQ